MSQDVFEFSSLQRGHPTHLRRMVHDKENIIIALTINTSEHIRAAGDTRQSDASSHAHRCHRSTDMQLCCIVSEIIITLLNGPTSSPWPDKRDYFYQQRRQYR